LAAMLIVVSTAGSALAQERVPLPERADAFRPASTGETSSTVLDRKFWIVAAGLNTAMLLDTRSTFDVAGSCHTCREANPFVAPFVRRGPGVTYTAGLLFDAGVMTVAAKMKGSSGTWMRRTWWVGPATLIAGNSIAYRHNITLLK